ncbi:MAG TPA: type IV toxin-antitoxin system AbiEi family antitoxin domain-containing protein [Streptosporangiaceae bacterium]|nr:type IV toxin-antitoxin system AbiEi family antitoxin domain-containing protein [Streptosporangiaceae bacterium]
MDHELPPALGNLARHQSGVISRPQALRAGLSADMIRFRVSSGRWRQVHPGVYATFSGVPGRRAHLWAAVLSAGPGAMLSHETAAELHGLADQPADLIYVTVPRERRVVAAEGVSIYRSARALETVEGHAYPPRTRIEETVLDLTQKAATFDDVCGWVTRAFARDMTDQARLRTAMTARTKLRWRADLDELITAAAGGDHSVLEYRYDRDVEPAHGLPAARRQVPFTGPGGRRGRRDRVYEDGLVVELDGRAAHPDESQWKDKARDNAAAVAGLQTLRYSWTQVKREPCEIAVEVATVLRKQGWRGRPRACSPACTARRAFPR